MYIDTIKENLIVSLYVSQEKAIELVILNVPADMNNVDIVLGVHKCHHISKMLSYSAT